jgi:hypothetical protein
MAGTGHVPDEAGSRSTGIMSMKFIMKIQQNTVSAMGATSLRLWALWITALAWPVDHFDQHFDGRLEAARHAGSGLARSRHSMKHTRMPSNDVDHHRVDVDDRKVDDGLLLHIGQVDQVVADVLAWGGSYAFSSHVVPIVKITPLCRRRLVLDPEPSQYALRTTTSPATRPSQLRSGTTARRQPHHGSASSTLTPSHNRNRPTTALPPGNTRQRPGQGTGRETVGHERRGQGDAQPAIGHRPGHRSTRCVNTPPSNPASRRPTSTATPPPATPTPCRLAGPPLLRFFARQGLEIVCFCPI